MSDDGMTWGWGARTIHKADRVFWSPLLKWVVAGFVVVGVSAGLIVYGNEFHTKKTATPEAASGKPIPEEMAIHWRWIGEGF